MAKIHTKFLLTEGKEDIYAVAGLMSNHVPWGDGSDDWPVKIEQAGTITELLKASYISTCLKQPGLEILGIMLDANERFEERWQSVRRVCSPFFPNIPETLEPRGLIHDGENALRLGVWIMPDNRSHGMLETFLTYLVPEAPEGLWEHAKKAAQGAKGLGAPFNATHKDKAQIHTWLAWQDAPGPPLGEALKRKCLDPRSAAAAPFADWFVKLYKLEGVRLS